MAYDEELLPASFRGIPFLVKSDRATIGRNKVVRRYPNQTRTTVQDIGGNLDEFDDIAVIEEPNFFIKRLAFQTAVKAEGSGVLIHPYYGVKTCSVTTCEVVQEDASNGYAEFRVHFVETFDNIFPSFLGESISGISTAAQAVISLTNLDLSNGMTIDPRDTNNIAAKLLELGTIVGTKPPMPFSINSANYQDFNTDLDDYNASVYESAQDAPTLANNVNDILESYSIIGSNSSYQYGLNSNVFENYGKDDNVIIGNTVPLNITANNRDTLNSGIKGIIFCYLLLEASKIDYKTTDDLQIVINDLTEKFEELSDNNNFPESTWLKYEQLYSKTMRYLAKLDISEVITKTIPRMPISVFLYDYYENFDSEEEIIKLNNIANPNILQGDLKMLTTEVK